MNRMRLWRWIVGALIAAGLLLAACGGSDAPAQGSEAEQSEEVTPADGPNEVAPEEAAEPAVEGPAAGPGDRVSVFYHGTLDDGEVFDSSRDRGQPFTFTIGTGEVIVGFDAAVTGLRVGETTTVRIPPAEAYGESDPSLIVDFPEEQAPAGLQVGDPVRFQSGAQGIVTAIGDGIVTIDANRPLAGETLTFEIELLSIE